MVDTPNNEQSIPSLFSESHEDIKLSIYELDWAYSRVREKYSNKCGN